MPQLIPPKAPAIPSAPGEYETQAFDRIFGIFRRYFNTLDGTFNQLLFGFNNYGTFTDSTSQTPAVINTAYPLTFNTTAEAFGVSIDATVKSKIKIIQAGVYKVQLLAQLNKTTAGASVANVWLRKNGVDVASTARSLQTAGSGDKRQLAWQGLVNLDQGQYIELVWSADSTATTLEATAAAAPVPAIPSLFLTVQYVYPA